MNDRAFRLDFFIAIAALLLSALTAGTLLYQTRVISDQYAATIWPYLSVTTTNSPRGVKIEVENEGLGPALIRSAQLSIDGKDLAAWNDLFPVLSRDPQIRSVLVRARAAVLSGRQSPLTITTGSIGPASTIRPGESRTLLDVRYAGVFPTQALGAHSIGLRFCYCSINASCWNLMNGSNALGTGTPQAVSNCSNSAQIGASIVTPTPSSSKR